MSTTRAEPLDVAVAVVTECGYAGLTLARLADTGGTSRMILHRRGVSVAGVTAGRSLRAAVELEEMAVAVPLPADPENRVSTADPALH